MEILPKYTEGIGIQGNRDLLPFAGRDLAILKSRLLHLVVRFNSFPSHPLGGLHLSLASRGTCSGFLEVFMWPPVYQAELADCFSLER